ncbi:hypothetical protein AB6D11_06295 [Vibrio splendidus]
MDIRTNELRKQFFLALRSNGDAPVIDEASRNNEVAKLFESFHEKFTDEGIREAAEQCPHGINFILNNENWQSFVEENAPEDFKSCLLGKEVGFKRSNLKLYVGQPGGDVAHHYMVAPENPMLFRIEAKRHLTANRITGSLIDWDVVTPPTEKMAPTPTP